MMYSLAKKIIISHHLLFVLTITLFNAFHHEAGAKEIKVGFIYPSGVNDAGWSHAHDQGRKAIEKMPGVKTSFIEFVSDDAYAKSALIHMAKEKYDLVFAASFGYGDEINEVGAQFPDTIFMHCSGHLLSKNVGSYFGRIFEARYLTGIVAGAMTESDIIGYVAAHPIPEVIRGINAFAIGVMESNPKAKIHVRWTNSWNDMSKEKQYSNELIDIKADVIAQHQDSPASQIEAEKRGVYSIGYNEDMGSYAPKAHLTAPVWRWGNIYKYVAEKVLAGSWNSENIWWGLKNGAVDIAPFGPMVQDPLRKKVRLKKQAIVAGKFSVFQGPIKDQSGNIRIQDGKQAADEELLSMDWFLENVITQR